VAGVLNISPSSVVKWPQRFRAVAEKMGGRRLRLLVGEHAAFLRERIAQGGFTSRGLVAELGDRGCVVDCRDGLAFVHKV
jgi:putative transposase